MTEIARPVLAVTARTHTHVKTATGGYLADCPSPIAAAAIVEALNIVPDLKAEAERLRGLLRRARIQIATHIHGRKVHDEIAAALGEVPTNG